MTKLKIYKDPLIKLCFSKYDRLFYSYKENYGKTACTKVYKLVSIKKELARYGEFCYNIKFKDSNGHDEIILDSIDFEELVFNGSHHSQTFPLRSIPNEYEYKLLKPEDNIPDGYGNYNKGEIK